MKKKIFFKGLSFIGECFSACLCTYFVFASFPAQCEVQQLAPIVVSQFPHDIHAFTQGLAVEGESLYESTGLYGNSTIREYKIPSCHSLRVQPLSPRIFGEGLAAFPDRLIQISWREGVAVVYDRLSLRAIHSLSYKDEGWGLCRDGETVWMSNGTSLLTQRDARTFAILKTLPVTLDGRPVDRLNDLECVGNSLYANVFMSDWIVRIDKTNGKVDGKIDASTLLSKSQRKQAGREGVLNGIAYYPENNTFFLTGKCWPTLFEVRFISPSL